MAVLQCTQGKPLKMVLLIYIPLDPDLKVGVNETKLVVTSVDHLTAI